MIEKLKPCPFCGGAAVLSEWSDRQRIYCPKCYCRTDEYGAGKVARTRAIATWNARATLPHEAADHIEKLETENEGYRLALADQLQIRQQLEADNARLREAGNELGGYAGHDDSCASVKGWATGPCNCGYTDTWIQWCAA